MRPSLALAIGAVFSVVIGLPILLAPAQMLSALGIAAPPDIALVQARDTGTVLIGVGVINWLARDAVGAPLRGLLWGNLFIRVAAMVVNYWELAIGLMPSGAASLFPALTAINVALIVMFALALRNAQEG
jgi:hypothetical protein